VGQPTHTSLSHLHDTHTRNGHDQGPRGQGHRRRDRGRQGERTSPPPPLLPSPTDDGQPTGSTSSAGGFAQPGEFPVESQKGRVAGIQADMTRKPEDADVQEGHGSFDRYKPAGKMVGKKTIVTGGDSGIGRAVAVMFAKEGADVALVYLPEEQVDAEEARKLILAEGRGCLLLPQDIREEAGCKRVIQAVVDAWGRIDVLVNNASVMVRSPSLLLRRGGRADGGDSTRSRISPSSRRSSLTGR
jgi:hypothetical protein